MATNIFTFQQTPGTEKGALETYKLVLLREQLIALNRCIFFDIGANGLPRVAHDLEALEPEAARGMPSWKAHPREMVKLMRRIKSKTRIDDTLCAIKDISNTDHRIFTVISALKKCFYDNQDLDTNDVNVFNGCLGPIAPAKIQSLNSVAKIPVSNPGFGRAGIPNPYSEEVIKKVDYKYFFIPKKEKGKLRLITAPKTSLKYIQRELNDAMVSVLPDNKHVLAYKPGIDYVDTLDKEKLDYKHMLSFDIKNFFHQINNDKLGLALSSVSHGIINETIFDTSVLLNPGDIIKNLEKMVDRYHSYLYSLNMDDRDKTDCSLFAQIALLIYDLKFYLTLMQTHPEISRNFTGRSLTGNGYIAQIVRIAINFSLMLLGDQIGANFYFMKPKTKLAQGRDKVNKFAVDFYSNFDTIESAVNKDADYKVRNSSDFLVVNSLTYLFLKKFEALLTTRIPLNYEDLVKTQPITSQQFKSMLAERDLDTLPANMNIEVAPLSEYIKETGLRPTFGAFTNRYKAENLSWVHGVPQGAPTSGALVNHINGVLYHSIKKRLEDMSFIKKYKICIFSDNVYVFYDVSDKFEGGTYISGARISNAVNNTLSDQGLNPNFKKEALFSGEDKKLLGLIVNEEGDIRVGRKRRREINQIIILLNKQETVNYKGRVYTRKDMTRLNGLINWLNRSENVGFNRKLIDMTFLNEPTITEDLESRN